ncbi:hypothetical protein P689_122222 [Candidatus Riesia pediculischaeffi PTSU]|uniref:Uncharacterized protein n=1 Tax=Candidatus Riesia pediculischaeffi PTSU TaxID=1401651 RepID=A0A0C1VIX0_9ENTR|nr:hypothetical protein P689_122222 [Candidatus Riesia pediculischaeffi PTSU]
MRILILYFCSMFIDRFVSVRTCFFEIEENKPKVFCNL